jgi:threonine dehydratase
LENFLCRWTGWRDETFSTLRLMNASLLDAPAIAAAAARLAPWIRRTPVIAVDGADFGLPGVRLVFKLEFLQHAGSFKTRGAFNNLLTRDIPPVGVVAASGGNHGAAVAYAAMKRGVAATIFVPSVASPAKMEQIRGYGATLQIGGERYNDALLASERWIGDSGASL